jgi:hypothetical protein
MTNPVRGGEGGVISMGSYVTHIATKLLVDRRHLEREDKPKSLDRDRLRNWEWMTSTWSEAEQR